MNQATGVRRHEAQVRRLQLTNRELAEEREALRDKALKLEAQVNAMTAVVRAALAETDDEERERVGIPPKRVNGRVYGLFAHQKTRRAACLRYRDTLAQKDTPDA
ncbi:MAG: hypothetical protein Q8O14_00885 [bacterium]|nr:hypothetical protein [bacterium]